VGASFTAQLDAFEDLSREARAAIDDGGARKLFPRLGAEWAGNKPELEREWPLYMEGRNEDDNSAE
jgi:hypothetical protein